MSDKLQLHDIQGLIMSGHKHLPFARYIFLEFGGKPEQSKAWLKELTARIATSEEWQKDASTGKRHKPTSIINIGISYKGLERLRLSPNDLSTFPAEFREGVASERRSRILGDRGLSAPECWDIGGTNPIAEVTSETLHVLLVLLAENEDIREQEYQVLKSFCAGYGVIALTYMDGEIQEANREHFGFLDGVSQPKFQDGVRDPKTTEPTIKTGEFILGYENQYGETPNSPQLNGQDLGKNGSFMVFRKLHQNVAAFWNYMEQQAAELNEFETMPEAEKQVWLASKIVGRWPSGAPMTKYPNQDNPNIKQYELNRFLYAEKDHEGFSCPRGSHIRRANPRDTNSSDPKEALKTSDSHMIIRRGMPYGKPLFDLTHMPPPANLTDDGEDRGLVFLAINASISRQFEFIQQTWLNNTKFDSLYNDKDPLVGDHNDGSLDDDDYYDMTIERDPIRRRLCGMPRFVTVKGGGYFFMPSITGLNMLSNA